MADCGCRSNRRRGRHRVCEDDALMLQVDTAAVNGMDNDYESISKMKNSKRNGSGEIDGML